MRGNKSLYQLILFIIGAVIAINVCYAGKSQKVRPLTLKVTDAYSKQPLQGIAVHYIVIRGTFRTSTFGILPPIEPLVENTIVSRMSSYTDINGEVSFEGIEVSLKSYFIRPRVDRIDSEMIFINLEPSEEARRLLSVESEKNDRYELLYRAIPKLEHVTNPNQKYKGYLLTTVNYIHKAHGREQENASVEFRPEDFSSETKQYFSVELTRR